MPNLRQVLLVSGVVLLTVAVTTLARGQEAMIVDREGVMRWADSEKELALFGVNYGVPFAHGYRALGYVGADRKRAVDADVAHMARLGLDAFRVHVWDREITDRDGNLIENDHLDLLDYLLAKLADRGVKAILTPIAWWGAGYPEPDPNTRGISDFYSKGEMTTDPEARRAQVNYVKQFIAHVNPYKGRNYAEDPDIVAVELFNEPSHPGGAEETTRFINVLAQAIRESGFRKPVFYNISQGYWDEHGLAVCAAEIDGVSVQWYPTGLVRNSAVHGNMLPNVDSYPLPFEDFPDCRDKARMVYEFDAADVAGSYMYPAMARSFRGAGFQWATQFAYDPLAFAFANTDYQTHFLNLVYTPGKAISFMIAAEAFRGVPRGASFGIYPETANFGDFRVSYEEDLSEMVADTAFYYSNDTMSLPPTPESLRHVAGVGSSVVVGYDGTGAYFLDRIGEGAWRLELYPDVVAVEDPYSRGSLKRDAVRVLWRERRMRVSLPDLGTAFSVEPSDRGNMHRPAVAGGAFIARPGVYILKRPGSVLNRRVSAEFFAPPPSDAATVVLHTPPEEHAAGSPMNVHAVVVSNTAPDSVLLAMSRAGGGFGGSSPLKMSPAGGYSYHVTVPGDRLRDGLVSYRIVVYDQGSALTFPGGDEGHPWQWDFTGRETWELRVVPSTAPVLLFDARRDIDNLLVPSFWNYVRYRLDYVTGTAPGRLALRAVVESFEPRPHHFALRTFLTAAQRHRLHEWGSKGLLRIRARGTNNRSGVLNVALVGQDGTAWGSALSLTGAWQDFTVPLHSLRRTALALLPRSYPQFLPDVLAVATQDDAPMITRIEGVQFFVSSEMLDSGSLDTEQGFEIEQIILEHPGIE